MCAPIFHIGKIYRNTFDILLIKHLEVLTFRIKLHMQKCINAVLMFILSIRKSRNHAIQT